MSNLMTIDLGCWLSLSASRSNHHLRVTNVQNTADWSLVHDFLLFFLLSSVIQVVSIDYIFSISSVELCGAFVKV
jgi:hypothetical protein